MDKHKIPSITNRIYFNTRKKKWNGKWNLIGIKIWLKCIKKKRERKTTGPWFWIYP